MNDKTRITRSNNAQPSKTDSPKPDIQISKNVYVLLRGMNGDLTRVYLSVLIESMAKASPSAPIWKILQVKTVIELLSECLQAEKQREKLQQNADMGDDALGSTGDAPQKFDMPVPVQLLEILKRGEDGKLSAVLQDELLRTCGSFFVDDDIEESVIHGENDNSRYRLLVFDDDDDGTVAEIRDIGEEEIHDHVTDFIVKNETRLAAKNDTELALEYLATSQRIGQIRGPLGGLRERRLLILYHVVDARFFLTTLRGERLSVPLFDFRDHRFRDPFYRTSVLDSELTVPASERVLEEMECLLGLTEDVNVKCTDAGETALHLAVKNGHIGTVNALIRAGADVNAKCSTTHGGCSVLYYSVCYWENTEIVKCLLHAGADVNASENSRLTALHGAVTEGMFWPRSKGCQLENLDVVKCLVAASANIDAKDISGFTPLFLAARFVSLEIVEFLLSSGADVIVSETALHEAAKMRTYGIDSHTDNLRICKRLIAASADVNAKNEDDQTPLDVAFQFDLSTAMCRSTLRLFFPVITLLLSAGAKISERDDSGVSRLINAEDSKHSWVVEVLKEKDVFEAEF